MDDRPDWWDLELEISSHCLKRMDDRGFNEVYLRAMMDDAESVELQHHRTFIVMTRLGNTPWKVIITPDEKAKVVIVVTAYADP